MGLGFAGITAVLLLGLVWFFHYSRVSHRFAGYAAMGSDDGDWFAAGGADGSVEISRLSSIIVATLAAQKGFVSLGTDEMPDRAKDSFSIGYIGGYVEAILNTKGVRSLQAFQTVAETVFAEVFENEDGFGLYERFLTLQEDGCAAVFDGMNNASADVVAWLQDNRRVPTGWSDHVHGKPHD